jgi:hypothetical protein
MGQLPPIFDGDRTKSEGFVDLLRSYFRLNHQVPAFQSYLTRIALALTLIQGPLVQEWTRLVFKGPVRSGFLTITPVTVTVTGCPIERKAQ